MLFASRVILNRNAALYPYHKWLREETNKAVQKPAGFVAALEELLQGPSLAKAQQLADSVLRFVGRKEKEVDWPNQFIVDSEMNWLHHEAPIDDL